MMNARSPFHQTVQRVALAGILSSICHFSSNAQTNAIRVGPTSSVSSDDPAVPLAECWLASNPRDPKNMIAASIAVAKDGRSGSVVYYTKDGGARWHRAMHGENHEPYFWGADPVIAFSPDGTAYYSDSGPNDLNEDRSAASRMRTTSSTYMYRSIDGGQTWGDLIVLDSIDHSSIAIDTSGGKYNGRVYVSYTSGMETTEGRHIEAIGFAFSEDDGVTYKQRLFAPPDVNFRSRIRVGPRPADMLVAPDGAVVIPYIYYLRPEAPAADPSQFILQMWVITSKNGGKTFSEPHLVATEPFPAREKLKGKQFKIVYWPRMVAEASQGPNRGVLYAALEDFSDGRGRVMVSRSLDMGETWSQPVPVSDDHSPADQSTPGIAVSQNGIVGVNWYDRRNDPKDECFQEYFSASLDGGLTFLPAVAVDKPNCTLQSGNSQPVVWQAGSSLDLAVPGFRFRNGGETQGTAAGTDGKFHLAWINGESGVMQLASSDVEVVAPPLGQDLAEFVKVRFSHPVLDMNRRNMSLEVAVTNVSRRPVSAPLTLVLSQASSIFEGLQVKNADNGMRGPGASWQLSPKGDHSNLQPGKSTATVTLEFTFEKMKEMSGESLLPFPGQLDAEFHVFEKHP